MQRKDEKGMRTRGHAERTEGGSEETARNAVWAAAAAAAKGRRLQTTR